ncbi:HlyD family efflux transporter periplasmic adaptor subunit, partial [Candidatus Poribacteria bacterium]|nr:HlyD family efflux transporter periplasmic adaptor subunit [Candidatus Poribacteria bacterium]
AVLQLKNEPWVRCYVPERNLGHVKTGMSVTVTVDTFPDKAYPGKVRRVSSEAEFTPRNIQTSEKRAELVFETKVDITGDSEGLRSGMFADVHLDGGGPTP